MSLTGSNLAHFNDAGAQPVVTIAIPTVDRVDYLRLAVESALAQTWSSIEVIVANNACTDGTAAYLATLTDPRLRNIVHPSRLSMVDNWNTIVAIATGKYFLLLSDDDLLHPTAIEQMVLRYETADRASTSIGFVYCSTRFIDKTGKTLSTTKSVPAIQTAKELILGVFGYTRKVMLCSILFRTADVVPGFPSGFQLANDSALWMPLVIRYGSAAFVDELLVSYRIASNLSLSVTSDVWMADNRNLLHLVFAEFKAHGQDTPEFDSQVAPRPKETYHPHHRERDQSLQSRGQTWRTSGISE